MNASQSVHPGELLLRRLRAGELQGAEAESIRAHAAACVQCRARLNAFDEEQAHLERVLPFEQFEAGVTARASARPRSPADRAAPRSAVPPRRNWPAFAMAAVALMLVVVSVVPLLNDPGHPINRAKGDTGIDVRISLGNEGPQRSAAPDVAEPLGPGERVRIGYRSGERAYVMALSIDATGEVSSLYPERGQSLPTERSEDGATWLPDSLEFFGQGEERVIVILSDEPLNVDDARAAAKRAYEAAAGELSRLPSLDLPGEQFHRTLLKP